MNTKEFNNIRDDWQCDERTTRINYLQLEAFQEKEKIARIKAHIEEKHNSKVMEFWKDIVAEVIGDPSTYETLMFDGYRVIDSQIQVVSGGLMISTNKYTPFPTCFSFFDFSPEEFKSKVVKVNENKEIL